MQLKSPQKWLVAIAASFIFGYSVLVLGFVGTSPDVRLRALLADEGRTTAGIVIQSTKGLDWPHPREGFKDPRPKPNDILIRLGDRRIRSFLDFTSALSDLRNAEVQSKLPAGSNPFELEYELGEITLVEIEEEGRFVQVEFISEETGNSQISWLTVQSLPTGEVVLTFVWFLLELGIFVVSALAVWHRPFDRQARMFFAMCVVTMGAFIGGYHWWVISGSVWLTIPFAVCALLLPVVSLHFFLIYPRPIPFVARFSKTVLGSIYLIPSISIVVVLSLDFYARWLGLDATDADAVRSIVGALNVLRQGIYGYLIFATICFVMMLGALAYGCFTTRNAIERSQMFWMLSAGVVAGIPIGYSVQMALFHRIDFAMGESRVPMFLASLSFMLAYAVGIARFKLMLVDQIVSKGALYYAANCALTTTYAMTVALTCLLAYYLNISQSPQQVLKQALFIAVILTLVIVLLLLLRDRFQQVIDRRFYREKYQLDKAMQRMNRAVGHLVDRQSLAQRMLTSCRDVLGVDRSALYLRDPDRLSFQLIAANNADDIPQQFKAQPELLTELRRDSTMHRSSSGMRGAASHGQSVMGLLSAELIYALERDGEIAALVALGAKKSGASFTAEDLTFLNALGQITSVALHSAKVHQDIARLNNELQIKVERIDEQKRQIAILQSELTGGQTTSRLPEPDLFRREPIKGNSPAMRRVLKTVQKVALSDSSVMIRGASGTGKELVAEALHQNSPRRNGPLVRVHCAALSPSLLESELFGHVRGAFTGAHRDRVGRFEAAHNGTLFLDEIGDISLETQIKLLRVLQSHSFEQVGGTRTINVNVRLITATHQDLKTLIAEGRFREDLYYRINVIAIELPPLRERREDIFELALHFMQRSSERVGKRITQIDEDAIETLKRYHWPGNIRELENTIERAVVLTEDEHISIHDLPVEIQTADSINSERTRLREVNPQRSTLTEQVGQANGSVAEIGTSAEIPEPVILERALRECRGNKAHAARALGMPRSTFYSKLKKYAIE